MLTVQVENYTFCEPELQVAYPDHWRELAAAKDIPLAPNYTAYRTLDAEGCVLLVTLRDGEKLVGYFIGFLFPELHYSSCLACTGDIFRVLPEYRKGQWAGSKLFAGVEKALRERKVQRWHVTSKLSNDSGALLRRRGFTAVEMHYSKRLDV